MRCRSMSLSVISATAKVSGRRCFIRCALIHRLCRMRNSQARRLVPGSNPGIRCSAFISVSLDQIFGVGMAVRQSPRGTSSGCCTPGREHADIHIQRLLRPLHIERRTLRTLGAQIAQRIHQPRGCAPRLLR